MLIRCFVWSISLYDSETWTLRKLERIYLESLKIWYWRRIRKIKWSEKVTNEGVTECTGEKRMLLNNILRRKVNWICYILKTALFMIVEGHITVVKKVERRRT
jgi:hypothetical protein